MLTNSMIHLTVNSMYNVMQNFGLVSGKATKQNNNKQTNKIKTPMTDYITNPRQTKCLQTTKWPWTGDLGNYPSIMRAKQYVIDWNFSIKM